MTALPIAEVTCDHFDAPPVDGGSFIEPDLSWTMSTSGGCRCSWNVSTPQLLPPEPPVPAPLEPPVPAPLEPPVPAPLEPPVAPPAPPPAPPEPVTSCPHPTSTERTMNETVRMGESPPGSI